MASGDENESLGYAGYMWEPEYSEEELFEILSDTEDGGDIGHARSADLTWCTCSFCASMPSLKESTCCHEFEYYATEYLSDTTACITCHEDFAFSLLMTNIKTVWSQIRCHKCRAWSYPNRSQ